MRYINLKEAEKAIIKRIDWNIENANSRDLEIRNECLEVLAMINDYIDIENNCNNCSNKYNQCIEAKLIRNHNDGDKSIHNLNVNFCPVCGRLLNRGENTG